MAERPTHTVRRSGSAPNRPARYRPVRSPLVSMGPSLDEKRRRERMLYRSIGYGLIAVAATITLALVVSALGREVVVGKQSAPGEVAPAPIVSMARPQPMRLAVVPAEGEEQPLVLQLPVNLRGVTGIGFGHRNDGDVLELDAEGSQANMASGSRLLRRFLATRQVSDLRWFALSEVDAFNAVYVGAPAGSRVFAPVSGTVVSMSDYMIDDRPHGKVIQLQPLGDSETVLVLRNVDAAEGLAVGQTVSAGATLVGTVRDMGSSMTQPLARFTHDSGTSVEVYVRRVAPTDPIA